LLAIHYRLFIRSFIGAIGPTRSGREKLRVAAVRIPWTVMTHDEPKDGLMDMHTLSCTESPGGFLYECTTEGCGRRLVVDRAGEMTVIDRGDQLASHHGSSGGVDLTLPIVTQS
jgi:hypothetical protein